MATDRVAILTDFGNDDAYVGIMKAVMLAIDPELRFIDLTQQVPPQNLFSAGYLAAAAWPWLPAGTVLLAVVDPGVGSSRRELVLSQGGRTLVAPDNGLATLLLELFPDASARRATDSFLAELESRKPQLSSTFDGRDLFSPLAAEIARGNRGVVAEEEVTPIRLDSLAVTRLDEPERRKAAFLRFRCPVLHVDHFGNCITGIRTGIVDNDLPPDSIAHIVVHFPTGRSEEVPFCSTFSEVEPGGRLAYWGSTGFLELAVRNGSYASGSLLAAGASVEVALWT
ncbi:SAM hydrolase/SAM-dependent halogenase family protein [Salinispira pacifica]